MTAVPPRPSRMLFLADKEGPLLVFEDGRVSLGKGWEPEEGARALLAWLNVQLQGAKP